MRLRVLTAYFVTTSKEQGKKKAFMQQKLALLQMKQKESVIEAFWKYFWKNVYMWIEQGVICGD